MADAKSLPYNESRGCPDGYHKRSAYTSTRGHRVGPRCVKSTTVYKNTSKEHKRKVEKAAVRLGHIPSIRSLTRKACPPGMIERASYVRRYTTAVRQKGYTVRRATGTTYRVYPKANPTAVESRCVKNTGQPGKGVPRPIGPLRKGELAKLGYSFRAGNNSRHAALRHAIAEFGPLGVYRKLNAVSKLTEKTVPSASKVFEKDRNWIHDKFGPLKAF